MTECNKGTEGNCVMNAVVTAIITKAMREGKPKLVNGFNVPDSEPNIIELK